MHFHKHPSHWRTRDILSLNYCIHLRRNANVYIDCAVTRDCRNNNDIHANSQNWIMSYAHRWCAIATLDLLFFCNSTFSVLCPIMRSTVLQRFSSSGIAHFLCGLLKWICFLLLRCFIENGFDFDSDARNSNTEKSSAHCCRRTTKLFGMRIKAKIVVIRIILNI